MLMSVVSASLPVASVMSFMRVCLCLNNNQQRKKVVQKPMIFTHGRMDGSTSSTQLVHFWSKDNLQIASPCIHPWHIHTISCFVLHPIVSLAAAEQVVAGLLSQGTCIGSCCCCCCSTTQRSAQQQTKHAASPFPLILARIHISSQCNLLELFCILQTHHTKPRQQIAQNKMLRQSSSELPSTFTPQWMLKDKTPAATGGAGGVSGGVGGEGATQQQPLLVQLAEVCFPPKHTVTGQARPAVSSATASSR